MERRGVELIFQYCVDNCLVKMADPTFVGFCFDKKADCAAKVAAKLHPKEAVGVVCLKNGKPAVVEYSEIDEETATRKDSQGNLLFNAAHLCMNAFSLDFVKRVTEDNILYSLPPHIANKDIPSINDKGEPVKVKGWKLELFIFDVFEYAKTMVAFEILRNEEFSPLKNAAGADSPETCKKQLSAYHQKLIAEAGGLFEPSSADDLCEVCPLLENLDELRQKVNGKTFRLPLEIKLDDTPVNCC